MSSFRIAVSIGALTLAGTAGIGIGAKAVLGKDAGSVTRLGLGASAQAATTPQDTYINRVAPLAQRMSTAYNGVPASVAIAQSAIESTWGRSRLAAGDRNFFGFKCVAAGQPGPIATACHDYVTHEDNPPRDIHAYFRVYASELDSFRDYGRLMNTPGYSGALRFKNDPNRFIQAIAPRYSTNPNYANSVIATMRAHNLYRFDHKTAPAGKYWVSTFANATGYRGAGAVDAQGVLLRGTNYVYCKVWGARAGTATQFNHWWLRTDLDRTFPAKNGRGAYVSAYYLSRWGNDEAKDNTGRVIPNC